MSPRPTKAQREAELSSAITLARREGYAQALIDTAPVVPEYLVPSVAAKIRAHIAEAAEAKAAEKFPSDG